MNLKVLGSRNAMGEAAGKAVEQKIVELLSEKAEIRMIFAAAPSQNELLAYLRSSKLIPWERITAFHMDEYIGLPAGHEALFANFLNNKIFEAVAFKAVHLIDSSNDPQEECQRYGALIREKPIDIVCLGIGENGHIAFNDPPVADFEDPEIIKRVALDLASRQQQVNDGAFSSLDEVPLEALTLTIPALVNANYLCCVVPGAQKREAVKQAVHGPVTTDCPASILQKHDQCYLFVDTAAYPSESEVQNSVQAINCITGEKQSFTRNQSGKPLKLGSGSLPFAGPGLIDLQVNGIHGVDFNDPALTADDMLEATRYLLGQGVTGFFPTLITNAEETVLHILSTIRQACLEHPLVNTCVTGIHLEGPFLSMADGARGAHDKQYIKAPYWELVERAQEASGGRIRLITLSPEWDNSPEFIKKCRQEGILVSMGHTVANPEQVQAAVDAGTTLSTHLGNGIPLMLPRHPNLLWEQLAQDNLYISIIADGFHLPNSFLKVALKVKEDKALLVSDATCFSGMPPGEYQSHIGDEVVLHEGGKLAMKNSNGLLAGATKTILENVQFLVDQNLASLGKAWGMGSVIPGRFLGIDNYGSRSTDRGDYVLFELKEKNKIHVLQVIKNGKVVYEPEQ